MIRTFQILNRLYGHLPVSVAGLVILVFAALGCDKKYCVEGLDLWTTYQVAVLEPVDSNSQYTVQTSHGPDFGLYILEMPTCGRGFDFVAGSTFLIEPISKVDLMGCYGRKAIPSEVNEIQLVRQNDGPVTGTGELMQTPSFEADRGGGCIGNWILGFFSTNHGTPLQTPVSGEYPPTLLPGSWALLPAGQRS